MIGLPTEEDKDLEENIKLIQKTSELKKEIDGYSAKVTVTISSFIPKPHTPWEREPMAALSVLEGKQSLIKDKIFIFF